MESITKSFELLKFESGVDDIDISSMTISDKKYGIIAVIHNNTRFNPHALTFKNIELHIHKTSLLLKNNQLVIFEDYNSYSLQYELSKEYNLDINMHNKNIKNIIKTEFGNINLYCVIVYNLYEHENAFYKWYHLYDFIDSDIHKYISLYKYIIDSLSRNINNHILKEITINYSDNNLTHLQQFDIKLYDIYKCLY